MRANAKRAVSPIGKTLIESKRKERIKMSSFKPTKINERVFAQIKDDLAADHTDSWIKEVYGIGTSTLRLIKHKSSFNQYKRYYAERLARRKAKAAAQMQLTVDSNDHTKDVLLACVAAIALLIAYLILKEVIS